jgi:hypothetical protein
MARKKWIMYGVLAAGAYWLWKQSQTNAIAAGAAAAASSGANAPNTNVSPTGAATTNNMQALAGATLRIPTYPVPVIFSGQ